MATTTFLGLALPDEGAENSGSAYNGNMEMIDAELAKARNVITKNGEVIVKNGDVVYKQVLGSVPG